MEGRVGQISNCNYLQYNYNYIVRNGLQLYVFKHINFIKIGRSGFGHSAARNFYGMKLELITYN